MRLQSFLRPHYPRLAAGAILLAAGSALLTAVVSVLKPLVNEVLFVSANGPTVAESSSRPSWLPEALTDAIALRPLTSMLGDEPVVQVPLFLVFAFFWRGIFLYFGQYFTTSVGARFMRDLRVALFRSISYQSLDFFRSNSTGTVLSRVLHEVQQLQRVATVVLADLVRVGAMVPFLLLTAAVHDWRIALVAMVALPLLVLPSMRLGRKLRRASRASHFQMAAVARRVSESVGGAPVVQSFGAEAYEVGRFSEAVDGMLRADLKAARARALSPAVLELVGAVVGAGLFYFAGTTIQAGKVDPGDFTVVLVCLGLLFTHFRRLNVLYGEVQVALAGAENVMRWIDLEPAIRDADDAVEAPRFSRLLAFEDVSFDYGDEPVLSGIDLELRPGEVVALVGPSGSGKTTLANLIPRFDDPRAGRITFDGLDLRRLTLDSLRSQVAIVGQEALLFDDTVRNNLAYGQDEVPEERIRAAAQAANAEEFIRALPEGYETLLGERGVRLSVGQRQRLTIARALLKDPPILILDEATSALDAESEEHVQLALERLMQGRTSLVIAHRLATVRRADRICVLENGRIVEQGRHEELLQAKGRYASLYALQFGEQRQDASKPSDADEESR